MREPQTLDSELQDLIYSAGFCFDLFVTVPWFLPLGMSTNLFLFYRSLKLKDFEHSKNYWILRDLRLLGNPHRLMRGSRHTASSLRYRFHRYTHQLDYSLDFYCFTYLL